MFLVVTRNPEFLRLWTDVLASPAVRHVASLAAACTVLDERPNRLVVVEFAVLPAPAAASIEELHRHAGGARLVLGATHLEPLQELAAMAAGAAACCATDLPRAELQRVVGAVLQGGVWVSPAAIPLLVARLRGLSGVAPAPESERLEVLTERQREVARMVGQGANNKQIARALNITDRTVKAHLTCIFEKLGVPDRLQLALYVTKPTPTAQDGARRSP